MELGSSALMPRLVATPHLNFLLDTEIGLEARPDLKGIFN
jgi:hypothetical protein